MSGTWHPTDDDLDGLARTIAPPSLTADEAEQHRTNLLASAAGIPQRARVSRGPIVVAIGACLAVAAAVILWIGLRAPDPAAPRADVVAIGSASFTREQGWPQYAVRVDDGRVQIDVQTRDDAQRFLASTTDAQIEVRSATFTMRVATGQLEEVDVIAGRVELRRSHEPTIVLGAGESWRPTRTAEVLVSPPPAEVLVSPPPVEPSPAPAPVREPAKPRPTTPHATAAVPPEAARAVNPGELEFRAGVAALRAGDAAAASASFAAACTSARGEALAEDACFWVGAAANRAGDSSTARTALTSFVEKFPRSARAGEASALLGWLLYAAGDLDGASARFEHAATDRVPKVRASAERGIEAIKRRRTAK